MLYGDRIRTPSGIFPEEYVEMRCFGPAQAHSLSAVLYRLMEITAEQPASNAAIYGSLMRLFPEDQLQQGFRYTLELMWNPTSDKASIGTNLGYLSEILIGKFSINPDYPYSFQGFCDTAGIALSVFGYQLSCENQIAEITINQHQGIVFLLYSTFTWNSFVDFPCGRCFSLKYDVYKHIQGICGGKAISAQEIGQLGLKCACEVDLLSF